MTELLVVVVAGLAVVAAATVAGRRLGIASPLLLVAVGVAASTVPALGGVEIDPEVVLAGVLPPLLYASAVSMPATSFRREFGAISSLSVVLVVLTALVLGVFFMVAVPGLGFAWGVALGAVVSPTDAIATAIIRRTPVSRRVVAILDGESLLNDATALVLLRTAVLAAAASFSALGAVGSFAWSIAVAAVVGALVGWLHLRIRHRVDDPAVSTVISFAVPFLASVPASALGASGLVAAVVAGLVTGFGAPRQLSPADRLSDTQNWRTVELLLEGAVFLTMGLQVTSIVAAVHRDHGGVGTALGVAAVAVVVTVLVRAGYVALLLGSLRRRAVRGRRMQQQLQDMQHGLASDEGRQAAFATVAPRRRRPASPQALDRLARRVAQGLADIDYFLRTPLTWRDGAVVVWAGMRGAVTVAAAQTLPEDTPQRSSLVLIAFTVAALSLLVQGGTIGPLARATRAGGSAAADDPDDGQQARLVELMRAGTASVPEPALPDDAPGDVRFRAARAYRLAVLDAQRGALLDARDHGTFDAEVLAEALATLDADQVAIELLRSATSRYRM